MAKCSMCEKAAIVIDVARLSDNTITEWLHCKDHSLYVGDWHDFHIIGQKNVDTACSTNS